MAGPIKTFRAGLVGVSVFEREHEERKFKSVNLQRAYKPDGEDEWKYTSSLDINDIPRAIAALQKAYDYCVGLSE